MDLPVPANEKARLNALYEYNLLDTLPEEQFDRLTKLASIICEVPIALISLIDKDRQWFKSNVGLNAAATSREISFCQYSIMGDDVFEVNETLSDQRFKENPLVTGYPNMRFYAGYPIIDPNGNALGTLCVIDQKPKTLSDNQKLALKTLAEDIMLQILANKQNEERKKLEKFFMMSFDMICIAGANGFFKKVNPAITSTLGWSEEELMKKTFFEFIHPDDQKLAAVELNKMTANSTLGGLIIRLKTKNNSYRTIQWISNSDHEKGEVFAIGRDITEQKFTEENLRIAKLEAERVKALQEQFIANMSHEIRTPMNAIVGFASFLNSTSLSEKQHEYVSNINLATENLLGIINDVLDLSKIEAGMIKIEKSIIHLPSLMKNIHSMLKGKATEKKLDFNLYINPLLPHYAFGDSTRISQVLLNLVSNAIKFTNNGFVNIRAEILRSSSEKFQISFIVQDSGIGIAPENRDLIFERFKQESSDTTRKYGGTGLGLSIVKNIVSLMDGEIIVDSEPGKGSQFTVIIPSEKVSDAQIKIYEKQNLKDANAINFHLGNLNILLVEDNRMNQQYVKTIMDEYDFNCTVASNGKEAVDLLTLKTFDIILMDIQMPVMDGYEATRIIRNDLKINTPIIALTANSTTKDYEKCLQSGMNGYVSKPYKPFDLYDKIEKIHGQMLITKNNKNDLNSDSDENNSEKIVDFEFIKDQVHGKVKEAIKLIEIFTEDTPRDIALLKTAIENMDFMAIKTIAHQLVSSYSIIGISNATALLKEIEYKSTKKNEIETISQLFTSLNEINEQVKKELTQIINPS